MDEIRRECGIQDMRIKY